MKFFDKLMDKMVYGDFIPELSWKTITRMAYVNYGLIILGIGAIIFAFVSNY